MTARVRVLLADDHTIVRQGLAGILTASGEADVVAEAKDGLEAVEKALASRPDIVILDLSMPRLHGLEAARRILKSLPSTRILVLTMHDDEEYVLRMLQAGAAGYLVKDDAASELLAAIRALRAGKSYYGHHAASVLAKAWQDGKTVAENPYDRLTSREREIVRLLLEGRSNAQVADLLCISPKTVDNHRTHIMGKLGVHTLAELFRHAARHGVLTN